jgi:hypothetical protein
MSDKHTYRLIHEEARRRAHVGVENAPDGYIVTVQEPTRSLEANAAMWPILQAFADQVQWPVNGAMVWLKAEEWKDILTAAFQGESVRLAQGLDGGVVMLGLRTSKFGKRQFSEWLEFLHVTAAAKDVDLHYMEAA